jgi:hypothetical protein
MRSQPTRRLLILFAFLFAIGAISIIGGRAFNGTTARSPQAQASLPAPVRLSSNQSARQQRRLGPVKEFSSADSNSFKSAFSFNEAFGFYAKPVAAAPMATLTVTNGNDTGAGSLRQAIADAVANDTINFQAGVTSVTLTSASLAVDKVLTIDGGMSGVTITRSGATNFRIFLVTANLTLNKLTVTNGNSSPGSSSAVSGGAIRVTGGALTLTNCTFSGNNSSNSGGAVEMASTAGALTVSDCTFTNNTCGNSGAAMNISST